MLAFIVINYTKLECYKCVCPHLFTFFTSVFCFSYAVAAGIVVALVSIVTYGTVSQLELNTSTERSCTKKLFVCLCESECAVVVVVVHVVNF